MVEHEEIGTRTRGGRCPVHVFTPDGASHGWMNPTFRCTTKPRRNAIGPKYRRCSAVH
jgi:hypothetical protein